MCKSGFRVHVCVYLKACVHAPMFFLYIFFFPYIVFHIRAVEHVCLLMLEQCGTVSSLLSFLHSPVPIISFTFSFWVFWKFNLFFQTRGGINNMF